MNFDAGTIITIVCVLLFYLRLTILQRQRIKKAQYQYAAVAQKNSKKKKNADKKPEIKYAHLGVHLRNWWMVGGAIILITFGAVIAAIRFLGPSLSTFWWIPLNLGIALFAFAIK
jgi:ABC-type Fe3+ transport system permease subunit